MPDSNKIAPPLTPKKKEILTVSARLFAEHGYAAVSMRELASEANIAPAALYHHYADKEALYEAVLRYVFADKSSAATGLVKGTENPETKLRELILWLVKLFSSDKIFAKLLHRELLDGVSSRIKLLTQEIIEPPFVEIEKLIGELGARRDSKPLAIAALAVVMGHFQLTPILQNLSGQKTEQGELSALTDIVLTIVLGASKTNIRAT